MIQLFYSRLYPSTGLRALAVFKDGLKKPPTHKFFDSTEDFLEAADAYNELGKNVYHGCAVYSTDANRKGENVLCVKSIWLDLDVGPNKPYATQKEAALAAEKFRLDLGLPSSSIVGSGGGLHIYWHFTKPVSPANWDRVSAALANVLNHYGVKHDSSRTEDKASILRIPGTSNYKTDPAKAVTLKRVGDEVPVGQFYQILKDYADANGLILGEKIKSKSGSGVVNKMMLGHEYPPSHRDILVQHCPVLREVDESGGHTSFEIWWRAMGVAKHLVEPEQTAIHWTRHRATTGHDKYDAIGTINEWDAGPTTCSEFNKHSDKCAQCPQFGKLSSPIKLGYSEQPVIDVTPPPDQTDQALLAPPPIVGGWKFMSPEVVNARCTATRTGWANNKMTMNRLQKDGTYKPVPFCDVYWQVMRRIRTVDDVWKLEVAYERYSGLPPSHFYINSADLASRDTFKKEFAAREIHIYGGTDAVDKAIAMARFDQQSNRLSRIETPTYPTMGWAHSDNTKNGEITGEFVLGDIVFRPYEPPQKIILADTVDATLRSGFVAKGTTAEWVQLVNHIYNRDGAEPYQFTICAAFASPLVRLVPGGGEWHGIPLVLGGNSGAAKTTTALVAMSVYAPGQTLRFSAQGDKQTGQGDTINALSIKMGSLRNVPFIMDEFTGAEAEKISSVAYMLANGQAKDRMMQNGKMMPNPYRWDVLSIATTNDHFHELLRSLRNYDTSQASQIRIFEISLSRDDLHTTFKDVPKTMVENTLLGNQFGMVGRDWLQFVVNNRVAIQDMLGKERERYMINPDDTSEIRYYKDLLVTIKVAAILAKRKGFIQFDVSRMMTWAERKLVSLRDAVVERDWPSHISDFVASLHGRTIVTKHYRSNRGRRAVVEMPMEPLSTTAVPVARKALEDRRFFVTVGALKEWAERMRMSPSAVLREMENNGYLKAQDGVSDPKKPARVSIGSGTTIARPNASCYELDYDKVGGIEMEPAADMSNVIQLQPLSAADDAPTASDGVATKVVTAEAETSTGTDVSP